MLEAKESKLDPKLEPGKPSGMTDDRDTKQNKTDRETKALESKPSDEASASRDPKQGPKPSQSRSAGQETAGLAATEAYTKKPRVGQPVEKQEEGVSFVLKQAKQNSKDPEDDKFKFDQGLLRKTDYGDGTVDSQNEEKSKSARLEKEVGEILGKNLKSYLACCMLHPGKAYSIRCMIACFQ